MKRISHEYVYAYSSAYQLKSLLWEIATDMFELLHKCPSWKRNSTGELQILPFAISFGQVRDVPVTRAISLCVCRDNLSYSCHKRNNLLVTQRNNSFGDTTNTIVCVSEQLVLFVSGRANRCTFSFLKSSLLRKTQF